jgi:hypothetical protein
MNEYPIAKVCPRCGSAAFQRVRVEKGRIAFTDDRRCRECRTRYTPPTPACAAILFIAAGGFFLVLDAGILVLGFLATARGMPTFEAIAMIVMSAIAILPVGIVCVRYGLRKLHSQPAKHSPTTRHEVGAVPTPNAGPPDDGFTSRAPANE